MKNKKIFITGIDTNVGKTIVSAILVECLQADYWKPIQAGELDYTDSNKIRDLISNTQSKIHPESYKLKTPESPHFAASIDNIEIKLANIKTPLHYTTLIIEGAGGLLVPINSKNVIADLIKEDYYVILISKHQLGSINHTLLSLEYLKKVSSKKVGIIFMGDEKNSTESIIAKQLSAYIIGRIPLLKTINKKNILQQSRLLKPNVLKFLL